MRRAAVVLLLMGLGCGWAAGAVSEARPVYVIPNFHPASCGWLANWSVERNYCANSYLDHLDRVRNDRNYRFAISECNNMIAILNFRPDRFAELKERIAEGRVEPCNAFFLEPTINLSGGEALVKCGVEGIRWQQAMLGVRPRLAWMIDVTGLHEQMAQITAGLGLDGFAYCRHNPTGYSVHWAESPDGTRSLAVAPGRYADWNPVFKSSVDLSDVQLAALYTDLVYRADSSPLTPEQIRQSARPSGGEPRHTPAGAPLLVFGGTGDYSLAPSNTTYPSRFLEQMRVAAPGFDIMFSTPGRYLDALLPGVRSGAVQLPVLRGGTIFNYNGFWTQNPRVKAWFRSCEQKLQAAEMFATAASLTSGGNYPVQPLYQAWLLLLLNMDRNTLWGAAGGMVFECERSWDARDRFESIDVISDQALECAAKALTGAGGGVAVLNPLNWKRTDPMILRAAVGEACQPLAGRSEVICRLALAPMSVTGVAPGAGTEAAPAEVLPPVIETQHYTLRFDVRTGALLSLKLKPSGRELLGGPANVIVAEKPVKGRNGGDHLADRAGRVRLGDSNDGTPRYKVSMGPLATVIDAESEFALGGKLRRTTIVYNDYPRIDFETELNDISNEVVVVSEFPLADMVREVRRGIPYGFAHASWNEANPGLNGVASGITPAVRWSHYQMADAGVALFDIGLSGREIVGNTPILFLYNAVNDYRGYPNAWLSGKGRHVVRYALAVHAGDFAAARIPRLAWEFNNPAVLVKGCAAGTGRSFIETSDNVIVEALRREGNDVEVRLAECYGLAGTAEVAVHLPYEKAALTDLTGGVIEELGGGPVHKLRVRPQQIVTLRLRVGTPVPPVTVLSKWDELVPESKRAALNTYLENVKGHPPHGK